MVAKKIALILCQIFFESSICKKIYRLIYKCSIVHWIVVRRRTIVTKNVTKNRQNCLSFVPDFRPDSTKLLHLDNVNLKPIVPKYPSNLTLFVSRILYTVELAIQDDLYLIGHNGDLAHRPVARTK